MSNDTKEATEEAPKEQYYAPYGCTPSESCWGCWFDCPNGETTLPAKAGE